MKRDGERWREMERGEKRGREERKERERERGRGEREIGREREKEREKHDVINVVFSQRHSAYVGICAWVYVFVCVCVCVCICVQDVLLQPDVFSNRLGSVICFEICS